jgi:peptidoglycan/xylan/chitin deacetylase (PgdA/CDA1 family)
MSSVRSLVKKRLKGPMQSLLRRLIRSSKDGLLARAAETSFTRGVILLTRLHLLPEAQSVVQRSLKALERHALKRPDLLSVSPHNIRLYEYFIRRHLADHVQFVTARDLYEGRPPNAARARIMLRHDVDYTPEQLHLFAAVEKDLGVRSDIYVILDEKHYDIKPYVETLRKLAEEGFVVGLHTLAPVHDDFYTALRREVAAFRELFGFPPRYFTIHGPPAFPERPNDWSERRQQFLAKIASRMASFGFAGSPNLTHVDEWLEDSCLGGEFAYLSMDWITKEAKPGRVLGVLMHPDHWTVWPPRWRFNDDQIAEHPLLHEFVRDARRFVVRPHSDNRH